MRTTLAITFRQHRIGFLLIGAGALVTLVGVILGFLALQVTDVRLCVHMDPALVDAMSPLEVERLAATCRALLEPLGVLAMVTVAAGLGLPLLGAVVVGAPLVAAEVEHTTAVLAWTLAPSRRRWFLPRVGILLGSAVLATFVVGQLLNAGMLLLAPPGMAPDPWRSLQSIYARDLVLPARAAVVVGAAVLMGAVVGRQVPALLGGGALAALLCMGAYQVDNQVNLANAVEYEGGGLWMDSVIHDRDGNRVSFNRSTEGDTISPGDPAWEAKYHWVEVGIPDTERPVVVWRNVAMHGAVTVVLLVAATVVVERRRPT